jgi:hypothetical protein
VCQQRTRADRAERIGDDEQREAAGAAVESVPHELGHADDPGPGRDRHGDAQRDDRGREPRARAEDRERLPDARTGYLRVSRRREARQAGEQQRREHERARVQREERAQRDDGQQRRRERRASEPERIGARADERVRRLHSLAPGERRQNRAVRRVEVARAGRQHERGHDERPQRQRARQAGNRDRNQRGCAHEVGADHQAPAGRAVGKQPAMEAEDERGDAVREPDGDHPERPSRQQGRPHQCDVLERVAELARDDREVDATKPRPAEQCCHPGARRRYRGLTRLFGDGGHRIGHAHYPSVNA